MRRNAAHANSRSEPSGASGPVGASADSLMPTSARNPITIDLGTLTNGGSGSGVTSGETVSDCGCDSVVAESLVAANEADGVATRLPTVKVAADEVNSDSTVTADVVVDVAPGAALAPWPPSESSCLARTGS